MLTVDIIIDEVEYKALGGKKVLNFRTIRNKFNHEVITDTGADVCCTSPQELRTMVLKCQKHFSLACDYLLPMGEN